MKCVFQFGICMKEKFNPSRNNKQLSLQTGRKSPNSPSFSTAVSLLLFKKSWHALRNPGLIFRETRHIVCRCSRRCFAIAGCIHGSAWMQKYFEMDHDAVTKKTARSGTYRTATRHWITLNLVS